MPAEVSSQVWEVGSPVARTEGLGSSLKQEDGADGGESQMGGLSGTGCCCGYLVGRKLGVRVGEEVASDRKAKRARAGWREVGAEASWVEG